MYLYACIYWILFDYCLKILVNVCIAYCTTQDQKFMFFSWRRYITRAEFLGDGTGSVRSDMLEKAEMAFNLMDRYKLSFRTSVPTLQRQYTFETYEYTPRNKTARRLSKFLHSCFCERFDFFIPTVGLPILLQESRWPDRGNRSQKHECGNRDWGRAVSYLGVHKSVFHKWREFPQWFKNRISEQRESQETSLQQGLLNKLASHLSNWYTVQNRIFVARNFSVGMGKE
jgi:hypothetical protein